MNLKDDLKDIYESAIREVDPRRAIRSFLSLDNGRLILKKSDETFREYNLDDYNRIVVVGAGKATSLMAKEVESVLGNRIDEGVISVKYGYTAHLEIIKYIEAAHPVPDENSVLAAREIVTLLESVGENDLVISLISGGGSALITLPDGNITLDDMGNITDQLLKCGASIDEINSIRKRLSKVKGGGLLKSASPATVINLMISDVVGDKMEIIASGPFLQGGCTKSEFMDIIDKYKISLPMSVVDFINKKTNTTSINSDIENVIIASNIQALEVAKKRAQELGYNSIIISSMIEGDTGDVANWHNRILLEAVKTGNPIKAPGCIISGGETTVVVTGDGKGGRNMEFSMRMLYFIDGMDDVVVASVGTDGSDGPTDAAGAWADGGSLMRAIDLGLEYYEFLQNNDAYHFFEKEGGLIKTGPTNTNVMDIRLMLFK